ncbi:MAG: Plug domain-containing protein, partial [Muribaculaceae bacterium]|nr:Plug domain-containing protein [Muribaculaceae bacterium]
MANKCLLAVASASLLTGSFDALASEEGAIRRDTVNLRELIVTAPLKTDPDLIPLNVTQVTAKEIEKSGESSLLPVLVSKVPGLFVTERGFAGYGVSGGSAGEVNIRGVGQGNK